MRNTLLFQYTSISEIAWDVNDHTMDYGWEQSAFLKKYWKQMILFMPFSLIIVLEYLFFHQTMYSRYRYQHVKNTHSSNTHTRMCLSWESTHDLGIASNRLYQSTCTTIKCNTPSQEFLPFIFPKGTLKFRKLYFCPRLKTV